LAINKKLRLGSENHAGSILQFGVLWTYVSEGIRLIGHHSNNKKITPFLNSLEKKPFILKIFMLSIPLPVGHQTVIFACSPGCNNLGIKVLLSGSKLLC